MVPGGDRRSSYSWNDGGADGAREAQVLVCFASDFAPVSDALRPPSRHLSGTDLWDGTRVRQYCERIEDTAAL